MKRVGFAILIHVFCIGITFGTASAFNGEDLQKLKTTGSCVDCDLSGAVLIHWGLSGADLSGANLREPGRCHMD